LATDVLPYIGALETFAAGLFQMCAPGALVGFSTETQPDQWMDGEPWKVGPHHRYAHMQEYVRKSLSDAGFNIMDISSVTVRLEEGEPVPGQMFLAAKPQD
ncbi:MAG: S-adenosylmethionine-dependent methyltransferase, partial [Pseudomonadota bacterium]